MTYYSWDPSHLHRGGVFPVTPFDAKHLMYEFYTTSNRYL